MSSASVEGKPLKVKAQGRYRHETRPERSWTEQSVKRLRKPEDAAQPGEESQAQVAVRFCKRRRAGNPRVGRSLETGLESVWTKGRSRRAKTIESNSEREAKSKRGR